MNDTTKKYLGWLIVAIAVILATFLGVKYPIPAPPTFEQQALSSGGIKCHSVGPTGNCVEVWNGGDIRVYSNQGTTSKFSVDGGTGDTTIAGNLAVSGSTVDGGIIGNNTAITGTLTVTGTTSLVGATTATGVITGNGGLVGNLSGATYVTSTNASFTSATATTASSTYLTSTNAISMLGATFTGPIKYGTQATYTTQASISHGFSTTPTLCLLWPAEVTATVTITSTGFSSNSATHANPIYWMCGK